MWTGEVLTYQHLQKIHVPKLLWQIFSLTDHRSAFSKTYIKQITILIIKILLVLYSFIIINFKYYLRLMKLHTIGFL